MPRLTSLVVGATIVLLAWSAGPASAKYKCTESKCTNPSIVAEVRAAVDAGCDCASFAKKRDWGKCWKPIVKSFAKELGKTGFPKACQKDVKHALGNSTCGRPGFVLCRKVSRKGNESCKVARESRCKDIYPPSSACGAFVSCAEACNPDACTTTTTLETTSTTVATTSTTLATTSTTVATTSTTVPTTSTTVPTTSTTVPTTSTTVPTTSTTVPTTSTTVPTTSTTLATTSTTVATTSTTIGPFCGDGVVNQVSEECDGSDLNGAVCPGSAMGAFPVCLGNCTLDFSSCPGGTTTSTTLATTSTTMEPTTSTTSTSTTTSSTTSSSTTSSTTTSSSSTTSTTVPTPAVLEFVTADPSLTTASGVAKNGGSGGTTLKTLHVGGLNLGGGCNQDGGACGIAEGPTPGGSGNQFNASCSGTSCSISARTSAETGSSNNCSDVGCSFGTFLPISNTATSTCVRNVFATAGSGTLDLTSGAFSGSVPLTSNTTLTGNGASPCPLCLGGTPLVVDSGTCDSSWTDSSSNHSVTEGVACTPSDSAGHTYDCVPFGADLGGLSVDLTPFDSGTVSMDTGGTGDFCGQGATEPGSIGCFATHKSTGMVCDYIEEDGSDAAGIALDGGPVSAQLVSVFCVPPVGGIFGALINGAADLPGPGATALPGTMELTSAP
jgi:hypothetical protein